MKIYKNEMKTYYGTDPIDPDILKKYDTSIFLAGPTPRSKDVESWRPEACKILKKLGYQGLVFIPEPEGDSWPDYMGQVKWEKWGLTNCDTILFWVPRNLTDMPAFTTNVEFGFYMGKTPNRVHYGRPADAEKCRYLDWMYEDILGIKPATRLKALIEGLI
jgi:hypothetical protein